MVKSPAGMVSGTATASTRTVCPPGSRRNGKSGGATFWHPVGRVSRSTNSSASPARLATTTLAVTIRPGAVSSSFALGERTSTPDCASNPADSASHASKRRAASRLKFEVILGSHDLRIAAIEQHHGDIFAAREIGQVDLRPR